MRGKKQKDCAIDLGLAISGLTLRYGETRTEEEMSYFCNCGHQAIHKIYDKAISKLRKKPEVFALLEELRILSQNENNRDGIYKLYV